MDRRRPALTRPAALANAWQGRGPPGRPALSCHLPRPRSLAGRPASTHAGTWANFYAAGVPTVTTPAFTPVLYGARSVVSVGVGGNYAVSRALRVHVGFFTDPSPVSAPAQSTFRAVDLTGASAGVSFRAGRLTGSLGISSSWGTTTEREVGPSIGGVEATTDVTIRTLTGLYSVSSPSEVEAQGASVDDVPEWPRLTLGDPALGRHCGPRPGSRS